MNIKIRDRRNRGWFYLDNEYLNGYAKIFGAVGTAIYVSLCRHVDSQTQKCFPSQELIGKELGIADRTVRKYIKMFEDYGLIEVVRDKSNYQKGLSNTYYLIDKSEWKKNTEERTSSVPQRKIKTVTEENDDISQRTQIPSNKTHSNKTHITRLIETPAQIAKDFFLGGEYYDKYLLEYARIAPVDFIQQEFKKFVLYWTELNKTGTKQRWEHEKTFEVKKRLLTWLNKANDFKNTGRARGKTIIK